MQKISLAQKKIIIISIAVAFVFLLAWFLLYSPARRKITKFRTEIDSVEKQIHQIEALIGRGQTIAEGIQLLEKRGQVIASKFPPKEEESLEMLSILTQGREVVISSINVQTKQVFDQGVKIEGRTCQQIIVSINMRGSYEGMVEYIEVLKESLPAYVSIENLTIGKGGTVGKANLSINLRLTLYLLT